MKKINELRSERADLIGKMDEIVNLAENEKRAKSEDEAKNWNDHNARIEAIDAEIKVLERQDELNKSVAKRNIETPEDKVTKRYDLSKAISAKVQGRNIDGLELEMHQEGVQEYQRAGVSPNGIIIPSMLFTRANEESVSTGGSGGHLPLAVGKLDVNATRPLYKDLGVTVYNGLTSKVDLPFSTGHVADFSNTEVSGAADGSNPTLSKGTLSAERVQGWKKYSKEYLAQQVVMPDMISDMKDAIDRAISNKIATSVSAANVMSGYAGGTNNKAAITWAGVLDIIAELTSDNFRKENFILSKGLFYFLSSKVKVASTAHFIVDEEQGGYNKGRIFGIPAYGVAAMAPVDDASSGTGDNYAIAYGDFTKAYIGIWGGMELLVDPYSGSDYGLVKITFSQLADTVVNALGFASKTNVSLA